MSPNNTDQATRPNPPDLIRGLGLWSATAIVIGDTIGTGIFLVTSDMARAVGSAALVFAAWLIGGVIVLFGAFCYAELGAAFPKAGGPYVYLTRGLGPLWGFLFGWMSSFLERPVAMATLSAGFLRFLGFLFPIVGTPLFTSHIGGYAFTFTAAQPLAALVVVAVTAVNYLSVRMGGAHPDRADKHEDRSDPGDRRSRACYSERDTPPAVATVMPPLGLGNRWRSADGPSACDVGVQRLQRPW